MKQKKHIDGNFGIKPQKAVKKWSTQQIGQATKFNRLRKFKTLQNLYNAHSPSEFSSNFLLLCTCSFKFGSGSLYLNWLEDNDVTGLQNCKKYPQHMISSIAGTLATTYDNGVRLRAPSFKDFRRKPHGSCSGFKVKRRGFSLLFSFFLIDLLFWGTITFYRWLMKLG